MEKLSLRDLDIRGKKILMRVDFNVPLNKEGLIGDDTRIVLALPSIHYILKQGASLILMSHFGRPKGTVISQFSLKPCQKKLAFLLQKEVKFAPDCIGEQGRNIAKNLKPGEILLLENLRFHRGEQEPDKDPSFVQSLASFGEIYVDDAFSVAHRFDASVVAITRYFPKRCAMGLLMEKELLILSNMILHPKRPFYSIIGGAKIGSKIVVLHTLCEKVDELFIGGGMSFTFLQGQGISIGDSIYDKEKLEEAKKLLQAYKRKGITIHLPIDIVITNGIKTRVIDIKQGIPKGWKGMDIGVATIKKWLAIVKKGKTVFWNGPMGVFEDPQFAHGTNRLAQGLSLIQGKVIGGGGETLAAIHQSALQAQFYHLSSGGGACLELIEKGTLPGVEALTNK